jgi:ubiquinone biosynthesis protein UbiJ
MPGQLISDGDIVVDGDADEAARLLNLFDRYSPAKAVLVRPAFLEHGL